MTTAFVCKLMPSFIFCTPSCGHMGAGRSRVLGPEHPDTYAAIESVAHVLTSQGDADALHNWYVCELRFTSR